MGIQQFCNLHNVGLVSAYFVMTGVLLKHFIINLFPTFRRSTMSGNIYFKYYFTVYSQALKFRTILFIYLFKQYLIIQPFTITRGWTLWCGQTARRKTLHLHLIYDHWTKKDNHRRYHLLSNKKRKKWLQYIYCIPTPTDQRTYTSRCACIKEITGGRKITTIWCTLVYSIIIEIANL